MSDPLVLCEQRGHVRVLRLNRPEKKNALSDALGWAIVAAFEEAAADDDVWVVGLTGAGDAFCSGLDLSPSSGDASPLSPQNAALDELSWVGRFPVLRRETWDGEVVERTQPVVRAEDIVARPILDLVKQGLERVVMAAGGTGGRARVPGISVAGKSGTTQVVSLDLVEGLEPEEIPLRYRDHALFAAFAPVESPEIVVVAIAEHAGGGGGAVAAPMVQKVLAAYFKKIEGRVPSQLAAVSPLGAGSQLEALAPLEGLSPLEAPR